ncbi:MAG TPA: hypothetical protein VHM88_15910 [Candidatus Acidoferrales bacterium]|nr:hypothetical protein [Candidatus Acidoferrales bacterium]
MDIAEFTSTFRLRVKRDRCGAAIIPGKLGHLYEHGSGCFGLVLEASADSTHLDRRLRARRRKALATGFLLHQDGDLEAILLFHPEDRDQARLAIRLVEAKRRRIASAAQLAVLRRARRAAKASRISRNHCAEAVPEPTGATISPG